MNNAAVTFFLPIESFPEKRFRLMIEMQVWSALELSQLVIPGMREMHGGWILNISSRSAVKPVGPPFEAFYETSGSSVYGLCKAALESVGPGELGGRDEDHGGAVDDPGRVSGVVDVIDGGGRGVDALAHLIERLVVAIEDECAELGERRLELVQTLASGRRSRELVVVESDRAVSGLDRDDAQWGSRCR